MMNTTQRNPLETKLSNLKMSDFNTTKEYIARFKSLKADIIQGEGKGKSDSKHVCIVLNNLSPAFKSFALIFYNIPLFVKDNVTPTLEEVFSNLIQHQVTLRNMVEPTPPIHPYPKKIKPIQNLSQPLLNPSSVKVKRNTQNHPKKKKKKKSLVS
jgi:hypothetical protein